MNKYLKAVLVYGLAAIGLSTLFFLAWQNGRASGQEEMLDNLTQACYNRGVVFEGSHGKILMCIPAQRATDPLNQT